MPQSYDLYESVDGATNEFDLTFGYIDTTHVSVTVDGVEVDFEFMTATRVALDVTPAAGTDVRVLRTTPLNPLTDFSNGSVYGADDLDRVILQAMYVAQESADNLDSAISLDVLGRWNALGARLINLGLAEEATDAVSKAYVDALVVDSGNVPSPLDPADDNKILIAAAGSFAWQALTASRITDSTSVGRSVLTAADADAVRALLGIWADNSVTLAQLSHLTEGDLLYFGAAGTPTALAKGSNGQLLSLAGGLPAWATAGKIAQVVTLFDGEVASGTTTIPNDDSIPQQTEGDQYMSLAITPTNAASTLLVLAHGNFTITTFGPNTLAALFRDSATDAIAADTFTPAGNNYAYPMLLSAAVSAGSVAATTFKFRAGPQSANTLTFNGSGGNRRFGGVMSSYIIIMEILP